MAFNLAQQMKEILTDYSDEVAEITVKVIEETAEEAATKLHTAGSFKGTKYRSSWKAETDKKRLYTSSVVYNSGHGQLTHLLEFGHAIAGGGRKGGSDRVRAYEHIAPINEEAQEIAIEKLKEAIESL